LAAAECIDADSNWSDAIRALILPELTMGRSNMNRFRLAMAALAAALAGLMAAPAGAWQRGDVENFATIPAFTPSGPGAACPNGKPACGSDIEGVAVGPDGTVYAPSFGFNSDGALAGYGELFVFASNGRLVRHFPVVGSSPHLIGLVFQQSSGDLLIADLGQGVVWKVDPKTQQSTLFMTAPTVPPFTGPGLNALTFDSAGDVYVSDSFQGVIWKTGPNGGAPTAWYAPGNPGQNNLLLPTPNPGQPLIPPFGANGIEFDNEGTAMFAMNTAYHYIVKIPVNSDGSAGTGVVLVTGINAPDGLAVDGDDNLWVVANQQDEIDVLDPTGKVIAKLGDFDGLGKDGSIRGLLFPASPAFSPNGRTLYVTNLALYLPFAGVPEIAVDSAWTRQVKRYNIAKIALDHQD
jgi:sugar lactone lactonase YvrE